MYADGFIAFVISVVVFVYIDTGSAISSRRTPFRGKRKTDLSLSLWQNGEIHYVLSDDIVNQRMLSLAIRDAISSLEKDTCIRFIHHTRPPREERTYVKFVSATKCHSSVGMQGEGEQTLGIGRTCSNSELILHELVHLVGLWHEHTRPDRSGHVIVMWDNVIQGLQHNFDLMQSTALWTPYDITSIMHYGLKTFSNGNGPTLQPLDERLTFLVGNRHEMSFYDRYVINKLYGCSDHCQEVGQLHTCTNEGFLNTQCHCVCPRYLTGDSCQHISSSPGCGGIILLESLTYLTSPNYPSDYENDLTCIWLIKSEPFSRMIIEFEDLDIEQSKSKVCRDELEVRGHHIGYDRGLSYCGDVLPPSVTSLGNKIIVNFSTNTRVTKRGFQLKITALKSKRCSDEPCLNMATCIELTDFETFTCICSPGWVGPMCDQQIVDGRFSEWQPWTSCVSQCGLQQRFRHCDNPSAANGGKTCEGKTHASRRCKSTIVNCNDSFTCDFSGFEDCWFVNVTTPGLRWSRHKGATPSSFTGPSHGHTTGFKNDIYMYLETSYSQAQTDSSLWLHHMDWKVGVYCMQFFYHMYGASMGTLKVVRRVLSAESTTLWQRSGNQGNEWHQGLVNILLFEFVQVGFVGIRGDSFDSNLAIDDVIISPGACIQQFPPGCIVQSRHYQWGELSHHHDCFMYQCFCNADGHLDCPKHNVIDLCHHDRTI